MAIDILWYTEMAAPSIWNWTWSGWRKDMKNMLLLQQTWTLKVGRAKEISTNGLYHHPLAMCAILVVITCAPIKPHSLWAYQTISFSPWSLSLKKATQRVHSVFGRSQWPFQDTTSYQWSSTSWRHREVLVIQNHPLFEWWKKFHILYIFILYNR